MPERSIASINPGDVDVEIADRAARRINEYLEEHPDDDLIEAIGEIGTEDALVIPRATAVMFAQILDLLAQGRGVQIFPKEVELSTQQAADMLNVSRPYLVGLLDEKVIPYRMVGSHRRVRVADLLTYKQKDDAERQGVADDLAAEAQKHGLGY